jgi:adenosine deaminase
VLDEAAAAERATGVSVGIVVATSRMKHPFDARTLARLAARHAGPVVGFGLSNDERRGDTGDFAPAFRIARRAGLLSVPHGGELLGPAHVREVSVALQPDRLGHGIRAVEDPYVLERTIADGVAFEVCPASNVALGVYADPSCVPLRTLFDAGATMALGADDPLLFNSRLVDQYRIAREQGFSDGELAELARRSIRASSADEDVKRRLLRGVDEWLAGAR